MAGMAVADRLFLPLSGIFILTGLSLGGILYLYSSSRKALLLPLLLFFFLGLLLMRPYESKTLPQDHIARLAPQRDLSISGRIYQAPEFHTEWTRLYLDTLRIHNARGERKPAGRLLFTVEGEENSLRTGDRIVFRGSLTPLTVFHNPGRGDPTQNLKREGIYVYGAPMKPGLWAKVETHPRGVKKVLEDIREKVRRELSASLSPEEIPLFRALLLGEQGTIPQQMRKPFDQTGTSHLLAISGLHLSMVALLFYTLVSFLMVRSEKLTLTVSVPAVSLLSSLFPVAAYVLLSGGSPSALRTFLMLLAGVAAYFMARERHPLQILSLAALILLLLYPPYVFSVSFQLSFLSVFFILIFYPWLQKRVRLHPDPFIPSGRWFKFKKGVLNILLISLAAGLGTAPWVAYIFNRFTPSSLIANPLVVPWMGFLILPLAMAGLILGFLHPFPAMIFFKLSAIFLKGMIFSLDLIAKIPGAAIRLGTPSLWELGFWYLGILLIPFWKVKKWIPAVTIGAFLLALSFPAGHTISRLMRSELEMTVLDVGQGQSILVEFPGGKNLLLDGGGSPYGHRDTGATIVAPFLWYKRITTLDWVVLSHPHPDHMGGLPFVIREFRVREFLHHGDEVAGPSFWDLKEAIREKKTKEILVEKGFSRETGGVRWEILYPSTPALKVTLRDNGKLNDQSLVLRLSYGGKAILIPGDIQAIGEETLLGERAGLKSEVIIVPHHGSKTSSHDPFVEAVAPEIAIYSVGKSLRYPSPAPQILKRYARRGVVQYNTRDHGALKVIIHDGVVTVSNTK